MQALYFVMTIVLSITKLVFMFPCSEKDSVMLEELAYTALHYDYVVVGGGIAGVTCLETVSRTCFLYF